MHKTYLVGVFVAFLFIPTSAFAAGFAKQSLFLSQDSVTEGDTVLVYAVVQNDQPSSFTGSVVLSDGSDAMGNVSVTLKAGEAQAVSVSWTPTAGSHTVTAELEGTDGTVVEKESETFDIAAKPTPASDDSIAQSQSAAVGSSQPIQNEINSVSPQVASTLAPVFTTVDSGRATAATFLNSQLANTQKNLGTTTGQVLGAETQNNSSSSGIVGNAWYIAETIYFYILTLLVFIIDTAGVFYPLLVIIFFYLLYRTYRWARRPAY
jgi:hypothetical protein